MRGAGKNAEFQKLNSLKNIFLGFIWPGRFLGRFGQFERKSIVPESKPLCKNLPENSL